MDSDTIIVAFIFFAHLFFFTWAILAFMNISYIIYNIFFLVSLLWSIHSRKPSSPLFVALLINVMSIAMDSILIGILYKESEDAYRYTHHTRFVISAIATFINLFFRLGTSVLLFVIYRKRRETDEDKHDNLEDVMQTVRQYFISVTPRQQQPQRTTTVTVP